MNHASLTVIIEACMNTQPFSELTVLADDIGKCSIIWWGVGSKFRNGALGKALDWQFIFGFEIWKLVDIWKNDCPFHWNYFWSDQIKTNVPKRVIINFANYVIWDISVHMISPKLLSLKWEALFLYVCQFSDLKSEHKWPIWSFPRSSIFPIWWTTKKWGKMPA